MFINSVKQMPAMHDVTNLSDHGPIILDLKFKLDRYAHGVRSFTHKPARHKANYIDIKRYHKKLSKNLHNIAPPASALQCRNPICSDINHLSMLNSYTCQVTKARLEAACYTIPFTGSSYDQRSKGVLG